MHIHPDERSLSDIHQTVPVAGKKDFGRNYLPLWGLHILLV